MDLSLLLHLLFRAIAFRQAAFHLAEATIVQLGSIGVDAGDGAPGGPCQPHRLGERLKGVVGLIQRHQHARKRNRRGAGTGAVDFGRNGYVHRNSPLPGNCRTVANGPRRSLI